VCVVSSCVRCVGCVEVSGVVHLHMGVCVCISGCAYVHVCVWCVCGCVHSEIFKFMQINMYLQVSMMRMYIYLYVRTFFLMCA